MTDASHDDVRGAGRVDRCALSRSRVCGDTDGCAADPHRPAVKPYRRHLSARGDRNDTRRNRGCNFISHRVGGVTADQAGERRGEAFRAVWGEAPGAAFAPLQAGGRSTTCPVHRVDIFLNRSPEQIADGIRRTYYETARMQMSDGTIYTSVFVQARGVLNKVGRTPAHVSQNGIEVETVLGRALKSALPSTVSSNAGVPSPSLSALNYQIRLYGNRAASRARNQPARACECNRGGRDPSPCRRSDGTTVPAGRQRRERD